MSFTQAEQNAYNFSEVTGGARGDRQPLITNGEGRTVLPFEIVLNSVAPYYCGEVREYNGIANGAQGRVNIDHNRVIRTEQIEITDTFVVGAKVYFLPGGAGAAGKIVDASATGAIEFGVCEGFGGSAGAHTYIDVRPYAYDEGRALEA